jgi:dipeptidyl aminopeptidase/acylaminoacyl peptidase
LKAFLRVLALVLAVIASPAAAAPRAAYSPAQQAAKADIPILLIHGKDDTVAPLEQARVMSEALTKAGKPHQLIVQKGADHWLSRGDTRLQTLEAVVGFLETHNPPN